MEFYYMFNLKNHLKLTAFGMNLILWNFWNFFRVNDLFKGCLMQFSKNIFTLKNYDSVTSIYSNSQIHVLCHTSLYIK